MHDKIHRIPFSEDEHKNLSKLADKTDSILKLLERSDRRSAFFMSFVKSILVFGAVAAAMTSIRGWLLDTIHWATDLFRGGISK